MSKRSLNNVDTVVLGLGLTGQSCVRFLQRYGANVTAMDSRQSLKCDLQVDVRLGEYDVGRLCEAELILISPGVDPSHPAVVRAREVGVEVIGDVELFSRYNTVPVIAITGSNGKSTVTKLVHEMLLKSGKKALMGGNIGTPVLELLEQSADILVLELSSFQLETLTSLNPMVATVLNISADHLDRHGTMKAYQQAKLAVFNGATYKVVNRDDEISQPEEFDLALSFGMSKCDIGYSVDRATHQILKNQQPVLAMGHSALFGQHNMLNVQAAACIAELCGVTHQQMQQTIDEFKGLPHRFETVWNNHGVRWINDSKATNVGATLAAINGLVGELQGRLILLAGGDGKGADFSPLKAAFAENVDILITLGKDASSLAALKSNSHIAKSLEEAVEFAAKCARKGDVVLLAPACASLDMFDNYQHRGECFTAAVRRVAA